MALLMAAVSSVEPLPVAPKFLTLMMVPLELDTLTDTEALAVAPTVLVARAVRV